MNPTITYSDDGDDYIDLREEIDLLKLKNRSRKKEPIISKPSTSNNYNHIGSSYSRIYDDQMFQQHLAHLKSQTEFEMSFPNPLENNWHNFETDHINIDNPDKINCSQSLRNAINRTKEELNNFKKESWTGSTSSTIWKDPRLKEKYSVLKLPWTRRSHTIPIDKSKISVQSKDNYMKEIQYTNSYLYDDGSDSDSTSVFECKISSSLNFLQRAIRTSFLIFYNCGTYVGAFLIVCLFLWVVSNQNFLFIKLFLPKPPESQLVKLFKYLAGMFMYSFNNALSGIQQVFGISTKVVYNQPTDTWPPTKSYY